MNEEDEDIIVKLFQVIFYLFVYVVVLFIPLFSLWILFLIATRQLIIK